MLATLGWILMDLGPQFTTDFEHVHFCPGVWQSKWQRRQSCKKKFTSLGAVVHICVAEWTVVENDGNMIQAILWKKRWDPDPLDYGFLIQQDVPLGPWVFRSGLETLDSSPAGLVEVGHSDSCGETALICGVNLNSSP